MDSGSGEDGNSVLFRRGQKRGEQLFLRAESLSAVVYLRAKVPGVPGRIQFPCDQITRSKLLLIDLCQPWLEAAMS